MVWTAGAKPDHGQGERIVEAEMASQGGQPVAETQAAGPPSKPFGEHVTIDGYGADAGALADPAVIRAGLTELCAALGMRPLAEPVIVAAPDNQLRDPGGWSGFLLIAESHIAIHTFPRRRFLTADVYTCKIGMDVAFILDFFRARFRLSDLESHFIRRGLRYPAANLT